MQQRTYARSVSGNNRNSDSQQSPFSGVSVGQANLQPSTLVNAPTSLTNLAQLSGISLVPVGDRQTSLNISMNNNPIISTDGHQRPKVTASANSMQQLPISKQTNSALTNSLTQYPPVYNLETIPSIQLLNRVTADQQREMGMMAHVARVGATKSKLQTTGFNLIDSSSSNYVTRASYQDPQDTMGPKIQRTSKIQVLPVSESIGLNFIPQSIRGLQPSEDPSSQSTNSGSPSNTDNDNMSLMKLMAILSNPALTITAVNPSRPSSQHSDARLWPNAPQIESDQQQTISRSRKQQKRAPKNSYKSGENPQIIHSMVSGSKISVPLVPTNLQTFPSEPENNFIDASNFAEGGDLQGLSTRKEPLCKEPHTVTLSWSSRPTGTKDTNSSSKMNVEQTTGTLLEPARMLQEFVIATEKGDDIPCQQVLDAQPLEVECNLMARKIDLKPLNNEAKCRKTVHLVYSEVTENRSPKIPIRTTKRRLYLPVVDCRSSKKAKLDRDLDEIKIEAVEVSEKTLISQRHLILDKIDAIAACVGQRKTEIVDPDDIFVDRSKKVMSRIESNIERKRKRRFEKISQRSPDIKDREDLSSEESDYELQLDTAKSSINEITVLPIQLPLEEEIDGTKKHFMSLVGLVSRTDKDKMMAKQFENHLEIFSALNKGLEFTDMNEDVQRMVDTLIQTGGNDINMRTETDIKRNELPFIEGLNRNTSRIKMNYMNALGLEKRSKRTTLYKVTKPQEVATSNAQEQKSKNDLRNKVQNLISGFMIKQQQMLVDNKPETRKPVRLAPCSAKRDCFETRQASSGSTEIMRKAMKLAQASCREALHQVPNKDEYMKSLGLMAS